MHIMDWLEKLMDWAWTLVLLIGGVVAAGWRKMAGNVETLHTRTTRLETTTLPAEAIQALLVDSERRLETRLVGHAAESKAQHAEVKAEISSMNRLAAESRAHLYGKIDEMRREIKDDFRAELKSALAISRQQRG